MDSIMVKLTGPAQSIMASGSLADALTFARNNKTAYVKKHAKPTNPRSPTQVSTRAMVAFLAENWKRLSAADMATWFEEATRRKIANYHAFMAANTVRWRTTRFPSKQDPATENPPGPAGTGFVMYPTYRTANMRIIKPTGEIPWGIAIFRAQQSGFQWERSNMVGIKLQDIDADVWWYDRDLQPGQYWYRIFGFSASGHRSAYSTYRTVVIT